MKTNSLWRAMGVAAAWLLTLRADLQAAPLTWFPGPSMYNPVSSEATVTSSSLGNVVVGGTSFYGSVSYPEYLVATNAHWLGLPGYFSVNIGCGAVNSGDFIIIYGGTDGTSATSTTFGYSPSGDTPGTYASMSVPRAYLGYAPDRSGNAYAIGGLDDTGTPLASAEKLNQDSGTWSPIASLPVARYSFPAVFDHTNQIYIFGGYTSLSPTVETADVLRYSTSKNTWTNLPAMPMAVAGSAATFGVDGKIYVVGGLSGGVPTNVVQVYNPASNSWTISTPLPESLSASAMSVDSFGRLIVMGGQDTNSNDVGDVWRSQQLGSPDTPPVLTQFPGTGAVYQGTYSSSIAATGNPQPVYQLISGPIGMTVDYYSGAISWSPQGLSQIGSIPVTIAAANYAGATNYAFNIFVPNPPPIVPTNLTVINVSDTSATITWTPEDPAFGLVTYSLAIPHPYHSPRGSGGGVNYQVIISGVTNNFITVGGLTPGHSSTYAISATGPGGSTGFTYSGWVSVTTTAPQAPTNVWLTGLTSTSISLAWSPSSGPAQNPLYSAITSYAIMEHTLTAPIQNIPIVTNLTGTNGMVNGLTPGQSHMWYVAGVDAQGVYSAFTGFPSTYVFIANPVPQPAVLSLSNNLPANPGSFQFTLQPAATSTTYIQATTNLGDPTSWVTIATNPPTGSAFTFTDTAAPLFPNRYYRVVSP